MYEVYMASSEITSKKHSQTVELNSWHNQTGGREITLKEKEKTQARKGY